MPAPLSPHALTVEYRTCPLGLDEPKPRLAWKLRDDRRGARQTAYRVLVASSPQTLAADRGDLWDSGLVRSDRSIQVIYEGVPLEPMQRAWWKVQTLDAAGAASPWSDPQWWEAGLVDPARHWPGDWIGSSLVGDAHTGVPAPHLRKTFRVEGTVRSARLYVSALGLAVVEINGARAFDDAFVPGWTDYHKRVPYCTYDVTPLLRRGDNAIGAILGDGWYCGYVGWRERQFYGERPWLRCLLVVTLDDGSIVRVASDGSWTWSTGAVTANDLMMGESRDARREPLGFSCAGFDDARWLAVERFTGACGPLVAIEGPPVRAHETVKPVGEPRKIGGGVILDFGQNLVGRLRLRVRGSAGKTLTLRHAEVLDEKNQLYTVNLRKARATDHYTLRGDEAGETFEPDFTFHGFRYAEIKGVGRDVILEDVVAVVYHSAFTPTGSFQCSDPLVNQLQHNIVWGWKGNSLHVPTDCPQRDERLGWTGDAQVFIRTACFNADVASFFTKWQTDLADAQKPNGGIPKVAPQLYDEPPEVDGGPAWADAFLICPWTLHLLYADDRVLERHYDAYARFLDYCQSRSIDGIRLHPDVPGFHGFGDWLALDGSGKGDGRTPKDLLGTAFHAHTSHLMSKFATRLGRHDDAKRYHERYQRIAAAFCDRYVTRHGLLAGATQTSYVLALHFDLVPTELRPKLVAELVREIRRNGNKLATGFVGTPYLPWVLSREGHLDVAYTLLMQKDWPSWLYAVTKGATTIWERWDGWTHDRGFQDPGMNSFNHYAYGAIGDWLYAVVAGIDTDPQWPGYQRSILRPRPGGGLTHASAALDTPFGPLASAWRIEGDTIRWSVTVPPNTTAEAHVPTKDPSSVREHDAAVASSEGIAVVREAADALVLSLAAGRYAFSARW
jgi:alpha-L-rhamnosidase